MRVAIALLALLSLASATVYYKEQFGAGWEKRWVSSSWKKSSGEAGKFDVSAGDFYGDAEEGKGLRTTQDARFYASSSKFPAGFSNEGKDLVIQFQVKFPQNIDCGGGYIKIAGSDLDQENFGGDAPYHIMFGPDICGSSTKKVHVIFHSPKKNENLLIKKEIRAESDRTSHVYTLIVHPDNTYQVNVDGEKRESGKLEEDWAFLPAAKIKDPSISKPSDWVDEAQIDDPTDTKPADWDSIPKVIPDPDAQKPSDWDDDADGEWEAPTIDNPEYKGEWRAKRIPNPAYKGPWVHPEIANPEYQPEPNLYRYKDIGSVAVDVWQVKSGTIFDNILVSDSIEEADAFRAETWGKYKDAEKASLTAQETAQREKEEAERKKAEAEKAAAEDEEEEDDGHDEL